MTPVKLYRLKLDCIAFCQRSTAIFGSHNNTDDKLALDKQVSSRTATVFQLQSVNKSSRQYKPSWRQRYKRKVAYLQMQSCNSAPVDSSNRGLLVQTSLLLTDHNRWVVEPLQRLRWVQFYIWNIDRSFIYKKFQCKGITKNCTCNGPSNCLICCSSWCILTKTKSNVNLVSELGCSAELDILSIFRVAWVFHLFWHQGSPCHEFEMS